MCSCRERWSNPRPRFRSISALSPSLAPEEAMLTHHHEAGADMETRNLTRSLTLPAIETSLTLCHTLDADESREKSAESLSAMFRVWNNPVSLFSMILIHLLCSIFIYGL